MDKQREIYFIDNVKFHIDDVKELGAFMEIEAIDEQGKFTQAELQQQCRPLYAIAWHPKKQTWWKPVTVICYWQSLPLYEQVA